MTPALEVEAEVEINSTVKVEINGQEVSDKNIGKRRVDHKNKIAGFTFVGLNVRPGPNKLQVTAIAANGSAGQPQEIVVMGRGPARRLEIAAEKTEIQAGGSDYTIVRVSEFDQWGNLRLMATRGGTSLGEIVRDLEAHTIKKQRRRSLKQAPRSYGSEVPGRGGDREACQRGRPGRRSAARNYRADRS